MPQEPATAEAAQTVKENESVIRRVVSEVWNSGFTALADQVFAPEYINHGGITRASQVTLVYSSVSHHRYIAIVFAGAV
jgi:hypothetical protein